MNKKNILAGPWFQSTSPQQAIEPVLTVDDVAKLDDRTLAMLVRVEMNLKAKKPCAVLRLRQMKARHQPPVRSVEEMIKEMSQIKTVEQHQAAKAKMQDFRDRHNRLTI